MPNDLISTDPIVAQNFYLELDGVSIVLSSVGGLDLEFDVVTMSQAGPGGLKQQVKTRGSILKVSDLSITRMAPKDAMNDPIWKWFYTIHDKGFVIGDRTNNRKNGSVVLYDSEMQEGASLGSLSLLMKGETLPACTHWEGAPARKRTVAASDRRLEVAELSPVQDEAVSALAT